MKNFILNSALALLVIISVVLIVGMFCGVGYLIYQDQQERTQAKLNCQAKGGNIVNGLCAKIEVLK